MDRANAEWIKVEIEERPLVEYRTLHPSDPFDFPVSGPQALLAVDMQPNSSKRSGLVCGYGQTFIDVFDVHP